MSVKRFRDLMGPADRAKYLAWRLLKLPWALRVRLATGERLQLRPWPAMDIGVAHEVFALGVYDPPAGSAPAEVRRVVDLGGNTGLSCLYWLGRYPRATVTVFEPHPQYVALIRRQLEANGWSGRATVVDAAAGPRADRMYLTDAESFSSVVAGPGRDAPPEAMVQFLQEGNRGGGPREARDRIPVRVADFFEEVGPGPIDLLKMDIEGGEHGLLDDPRFDALPVRAIVMEWHDTDDYPDGRGHCADRLAGMGYRIAGESAPITLGGGPHRVGIFWAFRGGREPGGN